MVSPLQLGTVGREEFPSNPPPGPCWGPIRLPFSSGTQDWNVYVKTSGETVSFDLQPKLARGGIYELRIIDSWGTITWELIKVAQP